MIGAALLIQQQVPVQEGIRSRVEIPDVFMRVMDRAGQFRPRPPDGVLHAAF